MNFNKTHYLEFRTKNRSNSNTQINYDQKSITNATEFKFLGLVIDETLSWKQHIEQVISKMSSACYTLRNMKHIVSLDTITVIYSTHIYSIMSCGLIFWGGSSYANKVFILQKKVIRIMMTTRPRDSCRDFLRIWK